MDESELINNYPNSIEFESDQEKIMYQDLQKITTIYTIDKFEHLVKDSAVVLLDAQEDMHEFAFKAIDDDIEGLKSLSQSKKFVNFTEEILQKVTKDQEFYTIIIQPYLIVQLKENRDEYIQSLNEENSSEDSSDEDLDQKEADKNESDPNL